MQRHCKISILLTISLLQCILCKANFVINEQNITAPITHHTFIDSSYFYFKSYLAYKNKNTVRIIQEYNNKDYRLNKYILLAIKLSNQSDTVVSQNLYSSNYTYENAGEFEIIDSNHIKIKSSVSIKSNRQFISIRLLPKHSIQAYFLYKPISFKEYATLKNILYNYTSIYELPKHPTKTYTRNIGFTVQFLFLLGMISIMLLFYLIAYYYLKDKIYLYYTFYLLTTFIQVLYMSQYIFFKSLVMFNIVGNNAIDEATKGLMIFFYCLFYKQAFSVTKKNRALYNSIEALKFISILYTFIITISHIFNNPYYIEPITYNFFRIPIFIFSIIILLYTYLQKNKNYFQNFIFAGTFVYLFFTALSTLQSLLYPLLDIYVDINILYLGVMLELIIFSIALIIRIKDSFHASEKLKDELIVKLQQNEEFIRNENNLLEEKVKERVDEINQQNILIQEQSKQALIQQFENEKMEIQMQALSAQMNPHFIFNCMNSIQNAIVQNDNEKASSMLHNFASLIRMVLEKSTESNISLEDEIKLIQTYLNLEQERTGRLFDYEILIDKNITTDFIKIPVMMLQPFLENSIWHGFKFIKYKGKISVQFKTDNQSLCCIITDNGIGRNKAEEYGMRYRMKDNKSLAITIIENKIKLLNQTNDVKSAIEIIDLKNEQEQAIGTKVILTLPIL